MMKKIFLDTSIIIDFSRGNSEVLINLIDLMEQDKVELYINSIVIAEFFSGEDLKNKNFYTKSFLFFDQFFTCIDIGLQEGLIGGQLRRKNLVPLTTNAIIASTCIINNFELATSDVKHFNHVPELKLFDVAKIS